MKWVHPWFLRMMACHTASRGPPIRIASGSSESVARVFGVVGEDRLVAAHPGVVVDVARLGHPHHRVDEQVGADLGRGPHGQLDVGAVHRVAGLEGDDLGPAQLGELGAELRRGPAQVGEVVVDGQLEALDGPADVPGVAPVEQIADAGVARIGRCRRRCSASASPVRPPHVLDV